MDQLDSIIDQLAAPAREQLTGRRTFLRGAAGLGLTLPAALGLKSTLAQDDGTPTPAEGHDGGYVGSHGDTAGGTGAATPAPLTVIPFQRYDPMLPAVQPGEKQINLTVVDNIVQEIAPNVQFAGWTFNSTIPGPLLRVVELSLIHISEPTRPY